jgi:hypothetical protein
MSKFINIITVPIHEIKNHHINLKMEVNEKVYILLVYWKLNKKNYKTHVLWKCNQNNKSNLWYWTLEYVVPLQNTYISTHSRSVYLWMSLNSKNFFPWVVTINMNKKTNFNKFKIQTPQVSNGLFLSIMSCKPKNYVICLLP